MRCPCILTPIRSNQTVAGLKPGCTEPIDYVTSRSNQTVAGLKRWLLLRQSLYICRSNQTVAGLKHRISPTLPPAGAWFKSDRCGIETAVAGFGRVDQVLFKSDRCGIETRTFYIPGFSGIVFKSDRCGIETCVVLSLEN